MKELSGASHTWISAGGPRSSLAEKEGDYRRKQGQKDRKREREGGGE